LRDAKGNVVDGLNYGGLVDPWASEGYQTISGAGESGCYVPTPGGRGGFRMGVAAPASQPNRSAGRYPDGTDTDSNCRDFVVQTAISTSAPTTVGTNNIKINSVGGFSIGQKVIIGSSAKSEIAYIATIGTTGGTTLTTTTNVGVKAIPVTSVEGFNPGQTILIDNGSRYETAIVSSVKAARRRFGNALGGGSTPVDSVMLTVPLKFAHETGSMVAGSGITFSAPLTKAYESGTPVSSNIPTPGRPNQYAIIKK